MAFTRSILSAVASVSFFFAPFFAFPALSLAADEIDPRNLPPAVLAMEEALERFNAANKTDFSLQIDPDDLSVSILSVGSMAVTFGSDYGTTLEDALRIAQVLRTYVPRMQRVLGAPQPPLLEVVIYSPSVSDTSPRLRIADVSVTTDAGVTKQQMPIIYFNTAYTVPALIHELAHAFTIRRDCDMNHLCETMSQWLERQVSPVPMRTFPSDFTQLILNVQNPQRTLLGPAGGFNENAFRSSLQRWLLERTDSYRWFDYSFGWMLGDVLAARIRASGIADVGGTMDRRIEAAHREETVAGMLRALGFASMDEFVREMQRAYTNLNLRIAQDPLSRIAFNREMQGMMARMPANRQAPTSIALPGILPSSSVPARLPLPYANPVTPPAPALILPSQMSPGANFTPLYVPQPLMANPQPVVIPRIP